MHVMSGPYGRETVHFGAPKANRLNAEMTAFLNWFETDVHLDFCIEGWRGASLVRHDSPF